MRETRRRNKKEGRNIYQIVEKSGNRRKKRETRAEGKERLKEGKEKSSEKRKRSEKR